MVLFKIGCPVMVLKNLADKNVYNGKKNARGDVLSRCVAEEARAAAPVFSKKKLQCASPLLFLKRERMRKCARAAGRTASARSIIFAARSAHCIQAHAIAFTRSRAHVARACAKKCIRRTARRQSTAQRQRARKERGRERERAAAPGARVARFSFRFRSSRKKWGKASALSAAWQTPTPLLPAESLRPRSGCPPVQPRPLSGVPLASPPCPSPSPASSVPSWRCWSASWRPPRCSSPPPPPSPPRLPTQTRAATTLARASTRPTPSAYGRAWGRSVPGGERAGG